MLTSVLLPVRNAGNFLEEALQSLEVQTCRELEVIAVDDGSTDNSRSILAAACRRWPALRVIHQDRRGIAETLNRAISESRGELLARMDADDISDPTRLERQRSFMCRHPEVGVCGSSFHVFGGRNRALVRVPTTDDAIRARMVFGSPFAHPSVMMRRSVIAQCSPEVYRSSCEDYDLWVRLARTTKLANLGEPLLSYRVHANQVTSQADGPRKEHVIIIREALLTSLGMAPKAIDRRAHEVSGIDAGTPDIPLLRVSRWLEMLLLELVEKNWCPRRDAQNEVREAWWRVAQRSPANAGLALMYLKSPLAPKSVRGLTRAWRLHRSQEALSRTRVLDEPRLF